MKGLDWPGSPVVKHTAVFVLLGSFIVMTIHPWTKIYIVLDILFNSLMILLYYSIIAGAHQSGLIYYENKERIFACYQM